MSAGDPQTLCYGGRFDLRRRLGEGGFGVVYLAYDRRRRAVVALKELIRVEPRALARFKNEFRSLVDLAHPNLVRLYELFAEEGRWYFTMEYVEGVDFLSYVWGGGGRAAPRAGAFDVARLRSALGQLAAGVEALHASGRLHRDLKPTNVRVTREGRVVVLDFGLVLALGASEEAERRELAGTPAYMSPEQACQQEVAEPTDCYAVGVMLFEALTGRRPFEGSVAGTLVSRAERDAPAPRVFAPEVPSDLDWLCAALLARDPDLRPSAAQVKALALGGHGDVAGVEGADECLRVPVRPAQVRGGSERPFLGRSGELAALRGALARAGNGQASVVLVSGPSGIGKSALLERFLAVAQADRPETVVLTGRCHQQESVPYKGVDAAVDALARTLGRFSAEERELYICPDLLRLAQLFPVLLPLTLTSSPGRGPAALGSEGVSDGLMEARQVRQRAFGALRELLGRLGAVRPVVLVLDDLQWGDDDSGALLRELLREPDAPPLCFVGAWRSEEEERSPFLRRLLGAEGKDAALMEPEHLRLSPLPPEESERLAEILLGQSGAATPLLAAKLARVSEGNPFLLGELSWSLDRRDGELAFSEEPTVQRVVERRLATLGLPARRLLEATALSGVPLRTELLLDASESGASGPEALATLLAARLLRLQPHPQGETLECYHDRVREAVASGLSPEELRRGHTAIVRVLKTVEGADPELIARHLLEAGERGQALGWLVKAAERAMEALAFDRAARLYAEAAGMQNRTAGTRGKLLVRQGEALAAGGRSAEAGRVYLRAAAEEEPNPSLALRLRAAELLLKGGHYDEGLPVTREVFRSLGMRLPSGRAEAVLQAGWELARLKVQGFRFTPRPEAEWSRSRLLLCDACFAVAEPLQAVDPVLGYVLVLRSTRHSLRLGDPFRAARALALHCVQTSMLEPCSLAPRHALEAATALGKASGDLRMQPLLKLASATSSVFRGAFEQALAEGLEADALLRHGEAGMQWESSTTALVILAALQWLGRWGELAGRLPGFLRAATERGDLYGAAALSGAFGGFPGLAADDLDRADRDIATFRVQHSQDLRCFPESYEIISRAYLSLYRGDPVTTLWELDRRWPELKRQGLTAVPLMMAELSFLRGSALIACVAVGGQGGEGARHRRQAARVVASLVRSELPFGRALGALLEACLEVAEGCPGVGGIRLARAVPLLEAQGLGLHVDAAEHLRGRILGGAQGRRLVEEAEARMRAKGVWEGARIARVFAPGDAASF